MLRVIDRIMDMHDFRIVVLALLLCLFACGTAMSMIARARFSRNRQRLFWLGTAGVVAGCGIWGTHFVAILAFPSGFAAGYEPRLTALSAVVATILCAAGFAIALRPKGELLGGAFAGTAIGAMHYAGMAAVRAPAETVWDPNYVVASILIGVLLSAAAMRVTLKGRVASSWALGAFIFALAIGGTHFTAMAAVTFQPVPLPAVREAVLDTSGLAMAVASGVALILGLGLAGVLVDWHFAERALQEAERLRAHVQELESTKAQLENTSENLAVALTAAASANRAKSQFLAAMGHELRTPLNAVIGFSDLMMEEAFGSLGHSRYREYLQDIRDSGTHLLSLINNVLDLSRMDANAMRLLEEEMKVRDVVDEIMYMTAYQAKAARVSLGVEVEKDLPSLRADRVRLRQILINLMTNALKFTPQGGEVRMTARRDPGGLAIEIADTGIGIAPEDIPLALDRFGQVDNSLSHRYGGAGLGLPLAKLLVELHGGRLDIKSDVSCGTTVTVILPSVRLVSEQAAA